MKHAVLFLALVVMLVGLATKPSSPPIGAQPSELSTFLHRDWDGQIGGTTWALTGHGDRLFAVIGGRLTTLDVSDPSQPRFIAHRRPEIGRYTSRARGDEAPLIRHGDLLISEVRLEDVAADRMLVGFEAVPDAQAPLTIVGPRVEDSVLMSVDDRLLAFSSDYYWWMFDLSRRRFDTVDERSARATIEGAFAATSTHVYRHVNFCEARPPLGIDCFTGIDSLPHSAAGFSSEDPIETQIDLQWFADMTVFQGHLLALDTRVSVEPSDTSGLAILSVANPDRPNLSHYVDFPVHGATGNSSHPSYLPRIATTGQHGLLAAGPSGRGYIQSVDLSDVAQPRLGDRATTAGNAFDLSIDSNRLYVANGSESPGHHVRYRGIQSFDLSQPDRPTLLGEYAGAWTALDVEFNGDLAYVAAGAGGFRIVDLAIPSEPMEIGRLASIGEITDVVVIGQTAYLSSATADASDPGGLIVVDIGDPSGPRVQQRIDLPEPHDEATSLVVGPGWLAIASRDGWLHVFEFDPIGPTTRVASLDLTFRQLFEPDVEFEIHAIRSDGDQVYALLDLPDGYGQIAEIDVARPSEPRLIRRIPIEPRDEFDPATIRLIDFDVDPERIVVVGTDGIFQIDRFAPLPPREISRRPAGGGYCVQLTPDRFALVCNPWLGLVAYDLDTWTDSSGPASRVFYYGDWESESPGHSFRRLGLDRQGDRVVLANHVFGLITGRPDYARAPTPTSTAAPSSTPTATGSATPSIEPSATRQPSASPTATLRLSSATPLASSTVTPTHGPSAEPTGATAPATVTAVSTSAVPTSPPLRPVFLPLLIHERCPPQDAFLDLVLVIDASTSMRERASDGRLKIDVAIEAASELLDGLRLTTGQDRAAVVSFNESAESLQSLSHDRAQLASALRRIRPSTQSRLDLGIERAMVELIARTRSDGLEAMVVLSDGKVNPVPQDEAIEAAGKARLQGIDLYVVGMGPSFDGRLLNSLVADPSRFIAAPDPLLLRAIYHELALRVPCPASIYWGKR